MVFKVHGLYYSPLKTAHAAHIFDGRETSIPRRGYPPQPRVATQERTLGIVAQSSPTLKGLYICVTRVEPLRGSSPRGVLTQGARLVVATLGYDVPPFQGAEVASTMGGFWLTADR